MAMTLYETTLAANNVIRFEFREPDIVKRPIRDATAAEMQVGGVFERFTILSVSTGNPATFTADRNVPATNTYVRFCGAQGRPDINTTGRLTAVSGATFQLLIDSGNGFGCVQPYNGAHGPAYTGSSATMVRLSTGTGTSRKYILGGNLDRVKDCDYFPGPRGDRSTSGGAWDMSGYTIAGKTITDIGFETNPYEVGSAAYGATTDDMRYVPAFSFCVYLAISTTFTNGTYAVTFPSGLGIAPQNIVINDKVTRCCSIGVNQNGHKADDESKVATLCQYLPQGANQGSMRFGTDYSISSFKIINSAGTEVWDSGAAPVLRLAHTTMENSGSLDTMSQDPYKYGVDIASVTPGNPTRITTVQPHGLITNDKCSVLYTRGVYGSGAELLYYQGAPSNIGPTATRIDDFTIDVNINTTGATAWTSGGKVTKNYTPNYAGVHTYEMDFSAATLTNGTYYLYIPGFGVSDPIYIDDAAWARLAQANLKALYNTSMGMTVDDRFGAPAHGPSAKVGAQNVTQILYSPIPHMFWKEQGQGRLTVTASPRFIDGTASVELYGGYPDAGDHDRIFDFSHIVELTHMLGPKALIPLNARYTNHNFPDSKANIGGVYTRKLFSDELDAAIWYLDMARRTQAVDGGIISAIQYNNGLANFVERIAPQPHWEVNYNWLALAPDHLASIQYAYAASLLAWHLKEMGHTELSNTWVASAQLAISYYDTVTGGTHPADFYTAAKALYTEQPVSLFSANPLTFVTSPDGYLPLTNVDGVQVVASGFTGGFAVMNGVTYCLRQSGDNIVVYDSTNTTEIDASGYGSYTADTGVFTYTTAAWRSIHDASTVSIQGFTTAQLNKYKAAASGILYNLTGTASYKTYHDANYNLGDCWQWGTYIYTLAAGADAAIATSMYSSMASTCNTFLFNKGGINDRSFTYFRQNATMASYGSSTQAIYEYCASAMISHKKAYADRRALGDTHAQARANSGVKKYVKHLQDAYGFLLGLNPPKLCLVMGYGQRNPAKVLNINADATGTGPPAGVVPYWLSSDPYQFQVNSNVYSFVGSPLWDLGAITSGGSVDTTTALIPTRFCRPRMMSFIPIPFLVEHTEYNLAKHYYLNGIASYLSSWAGDCVQSDGKKRLIARAA